MFVTFPVKASMASSSKWETGNPLLSGPELTSELVALSGCFQWKEDRKEKLKYKDEEMHFTLHHSSTCHKTTLEIHTLIFV